MRTNLTLGAVGLLMDGCHENPFELLGPHEILQEGRRALAIRALLPGSQQAWVRDPGQGVLCPMRRIHPAGLYEALCPLSTKTELQPYLFEVADHRGERTTMYDPYAFPPLLTDYDLYLLGEGRHWKSYHRLGAQIRTVNGVKGVNFAVWAPNAKGMSLIGDFNAWNPLKHPMRKRIPSGVWELFVPGLDVGVVYKYAVRRGDEICEKSDPYGLAAEIPPCTASIVVDLDDYSWRDDDWMDSRVRHNRLDGPISAYEVHLGVDAAPKARLFSLILIDVHWCSSMFM